MYLGKKNYTYSAVASCHFTDLSPALVLISYTIYVMQFDAILAMGLSIPVF